jgi:hypothetical protein
VTPILGSRAAVVIVATIFDDGIPKMDFGVK